MSKKIMKRSLALGALMAFVITGSAWAEEIHNSQVNVSSDTTFSLENGDSFPARSITNNGEYAIKHTGDTLTIKGLTLSGIDKTIVTIKSGQTHSAQSAVLNTTGGKLIL